MRDVAHLGPGWAPLGAALLTLLAAGAAVLEGLLAGGPTGGLTPFSELARLMRQRRRTTVLADRLLWRVGGGGLVVSAFLMVVMVPFGRWVLVDAPVGVVWFNAMDVFAWALVWLAGWGPNAAYAVVGGYRFLAQALAYELPLMFALTAPSVAARSLRVSDVAAAQSGLWYVVWMPGAFVIYCVGVMGFSVWGPLSAALGRDVAGGVLAELSGIDRLLVQAGRRLMLSAGAVFAVPLFLGGGAGPVLPPGGWLLVKAAAVLAVLVCVAGRAPLWRPDRFAAAGWLVLLPLAILQVLAVSVVVVVRS